MNFILLHFCLTFFYTLTYEQVGKIQKTEKKTKHIQCIHRRLTLKKKRETNKPQYLLFYLHEKIMVGKVVPNWRQTFCAGLQFFVVFIIES